MAVNEIINIKRSTDRVHKKKKKKKLTVKQVSNKRCSEKKCSAENVPVEQSEQVVKIFGKHLNDFNKVAGI